MKSAAHKFFMFAFKLQSLAKAVDTVTGSNTSALRQLEGSWLLLNGGGRLGS
jgi:hypothetical protein